ncbi:hypothetical protein IMSHALPRED_007433 [Imshaugia aleurites]|uniref:Uncharacterized protein n=1 Tax=Imshaugia aleurites TaxID=172621 RepID=A0A8H3FS10_9LECA|nr:hypothetical protein IMSHALPRED_007433 [Imshaugia aleurites]
MHSVLKSPLTPPVCNHTTSSYLHCLLDNALPLKFQELMVANAGIKDVDRMETGHVPVVSTKKTGEVTTWTQERNWVKGQVDKISGLRVMRVSKLWSILEICDGIHVPWRWRGRRPWWRGLYDFGVSRSLLG